MFKKFGVMKNFSHMALIIMILLILGTDECTIMAILYYVHNFRQDQITKNNENK